MHADVPTHPASCTWLSKCRTFLDKAQLLVAIEVSGRWLDAIFSQRESHEGIAFKVLFVLIYVFISPLWLYVENGM